jgi:alternate F1F0 ATPase F1 subunit epsilon
MRVRVSLPSESYTFDHVESLDVASTLGRWTLLPKHVDCALPLQSGLARMVTEDTEEHYLGIGGGTLVKTGGTIAIVTPRAVVGHALGEISSALEAERRERSQRAREAQRTLAHLEIELARATLSTGEEPIERRP